MSFEGVLWYVYYRQNKYLNSHLFIVLGGKEASMFSPMKLLVLIAIIAVIWFGFKAIGKRNKIREEKAEALAREESSAGSRDQDS